MHAGMTDSGKGYQPHYAASCGELSKQGCAPFGVSIQLYFFVNLYPCLSSMLKIWITRLVGS